MANLKTEEFRRLTNQYLVNYKPGVGNWHIRLSPTSIDKSNVIIEEFVTYESAKTCYDEIKKTRKFESIGEASSELDPKIISMWQED